MERQADIARLESIHQLVVRLGANLGGMVIAMQEDVRVLYELLSADSYVVQQLRSQGAMLNNIRTRQSGIMDRQFRILQLANRMDLRSAAMYSEYRVRRRRRQFARARGQDDGGAPQAAEDDDADIQVVYERSLSPEYRPTSGGRSRSSSPDYNPPEPAGQERERSLEYIISDEEEVNNNN